MAGASSRNVDFSNVKDGGGFNRKRIPAGDYLATVTKIEDAEAKDGVFQYLVSIKINSKATSILPYYCKLQENQLWKLRNLMIAAGLTVPKKRIKVDPSKIVGKLIGVTVEDDEYDGKEQSSIAAVFPAAELAEGSDPAEDEPEDDEDESTDIDEPEEDEEPEDEPEEEVDPLADLDRAALKAELKKLDSSFQAKKSQSDDDLRDLLRAAQGGTEADDEDEEEEEPKPAPKPAARKKVAAKSKPKPKPTEVSDDDLEELDIDDL